MEESNLLLWVSAMLIAGISGGLLAGLLGVGGGIVIVPVLYHILGSMEVPELIRMKIAVGSSLTTIIITSFISSRSHAKRDSVDWALLKSWALWIFLGVLLGLTIAGLVGGQFLTAVFATVALIVSLNMLFGNADKSLYNGFPSLGIKRLMGLIIGSISTLMGIGGGTLSVPILNTFGFNMRKAVGTGATIGMVIAIPGTLGYLVQGLDAADLPPYSLGFINLLAVLIIIPMTSLMAPIGAKIAHAIPEKLLRKLFAVFLGLTSFKMFYDLI